MKNNNNTKKSRALMIFTLTLSVMLIAGAVIASRMGVSSTYIAVGEGVALCMGIGVGFPVILASHGADSKDAGRR